MSSTLNRSVITANWQCCHYCNSMFAVIDPETCTCGPTCKAKLFTGLKHLQEFQTSKKENKKLIDWLERHPRIKMTYETDHTKTYMVLELLRNVTSGYDKTYMNRLFNSWN